MIRISDETKINMVVNQLEQDAYKCKEVTQDWLDENIKVYCSEFNILDHIPTIEKLFRERITVYVKDTAVLTDNTEDHKDWLTEDRKLTINWYFWERYKQYFKEKNISESTLRRTDEDTDLILSRMKDPYSPYDFLCRGMVIGNVQSGKTNNYTALINKAADVGYKIIIILTGTIEDLRRQTQERLDEDFVGCVSIAEKFNQDRETVHIGVGKSLNARIPVCLTDREDDIKKSSARFAINAINEPILVVTKKNKHMLQRLISWLTSKINTESGKVSHPVLVIDDEADNASVNTGKDDEDPKTINRLIREVLHACRKVSYVAYTATPFANIFIHPSSEGDIAETEDLFPKDFIVSLVPSTKYFGANYFFRNDDVTDRICIEIDDADEHLPIVHRPGTPVSSIPTSLKEAIGVFLLACAIKDIRRNKFLIKNPFDSMLINMSRLTTIQSDIKPYVDICLDDYIDAISIYAAKNNPQFSSSVMQTLYSYWKKHYQAASKETWEDICQVLITMEKPKTITVHGKSGEVLNFDKNGPRKIIAIGGQKLSRGLTLEGLVISYFYRRSIMYDSLMQMGRWYGYREGYEDLLKIWLTNESKNWYAHISEASDDLCEQIAEMQRKKMTPSQFGLKVLSSPDALMVTAANKMKTAKEIEIRLNFDNKLWETDCVDSRPEIIEYNLNNFSKFIIKIANKRYTGDDIPDDQRHHIHFRNIESQEAINCLSSLINHPSSGLWADNDKLLPFLEYHSKNELAFWDVFIFQLKNESSEYWEIENGEKFGCVKRSIVSEPKNKKNLYEMRLSRKQRIADKGVEALGLTEQEIEDLKKATGKESFTDSEFRRIRKKPSLIFFLINAVEPNESQTFKTNVLGWAISIPPIYNLQSEVLWTVTMDWYERYVTEWTEELDE